MKQTISLKRNILSDNDKLATKIRKLLDKHKILSINIMASPGAGKTTLISKTIEKLKNIYRLALIDGDICPIDLKKLSDHQIPMVLANTGGNCHLDAALILKALNKIDLNKIDLLIVENIGNLICPASFNLGTHKNILIASVPEGDDKPYKYPAMYINADLLVLNKVDYLKNQDFDLNYFSKGVKKLNNNLEILKISCKTGEGIDEWISWIKQNIYINVYH